MELAKNDSKMLQGLSVLAMIWLHLFDRDYTGLFTPIFFVGGVPLSFYLGQLSDFCVFGFAFLSGYAHMMQCGQTGYYQRRLKGLLSVFCSYWLILIVFSIVGIAIGQGDYMPGSPQKFILNALTLESSYNGALALQYQVFTRLFKIWEKIPKAARWLIAAVLMLGMLYGRTKIVPSLFAAPVSGFVVMTLFHFWNKPEAVKKAFLLVGGHSTNIWLTHMFFYSSMFKNLVYIAKYPLLIFAFMLAITIPLSMLLQLVEAPIQKRIARF